jgi:transcriptional regulator with XRE-family HTH domain
MITMKAISDTDAKGARTVRGASQAEVSAALGINRTYYSLFEDGRYSLSNDEEAKLAEFFEISPRLAEMTTQTKMTRALLQLPTRLTKCKTS